MLEAAVVGVSVKRSKPGTEEDVRRDGGGGDVSKEMRLLVLGFLELDEERGGWGEGDLCPPVGRGTEMTCRVQINMNYLFSQQANCERTKYMFSVNQHPWLIHRIMYTNNMYHDNTTSFLGGVTFLS